MEVGLWSSKKNNNRCHKLRWLVPSQKKMTLGYARKQILVAQLFSRPNVTNEINRHKAPRHLGFVRAENLSFVKTFGQSNCCSNFICCLPNWHTFRTGNQTTIVFGLDKAPSLSIIISSLSTTDLIETLLYNTLFHSRKKKSDSDSAWIENCISIIEKKLILYNKILMNISTKMADLWNCDWELGKTESRGKTGLR